MKRLMKTTIVIVVASVGVVLASAPAWAVPTTAPSAPEIGASALPAALGLLGAGVMVLRSRFRK